MNPTPAEVAAREFAATIVGLSDKSIVALAAIISKHMQAEREELEIRHAAIMLHTQLIVDENTQLRQRLQEAKLKSETSREMLSGFIDCYKRLMDAAPWSESNDMDIEDEMMCGLEGLIQERDEVRREVETLQTRHAATMLHTQSVVDENTQLSADNQQLRDELELQARKAKALDWLNTVEGMDWLSHCDYGDATLEAIESAINNPKP